MLLRYAVEKLYVATHILVAGQGTIGERLLEVYNDSGLLFVDQHDVPAELLEDLGLVKEGLRRLQTATPLNTEGKIELAGKIFALYCDISRIDAQG